MTRFRLGLAPAAVLLGLLGFGRLPSAAESFAAALGCFLFATIGWLVVVRDVVRGLRRPSFVESLFWVVAAHALCLPMAPDLSDDIYRYVFEGRAVLHGINPYLHAPLDPALAALRDVHWELINNKAIPAAYPPAVQLANAVGVSLGLGIESLGVPRGLGAVYGIKAVYALLNLCVFAMLWRLLPTVGVPACRALVYGLCPLLAVEFAGEGHSDALAVAGIVAALLAGRTARSWCAGAALGVATAAKLMPVVLLPFLLRRAGERPGGRRAVALCFVGVVTALYLPFLWQGESILTGTLQYVVRWRSNDSLFAVVHGALEWLNGLGLLPRFEVQRLAKVPIALAGILLLWVAWRRRCSALRAGLWFFVYFVAAAPTLHPWYVAFLVPFLCVAPQPGWLVFAGSVFLSYHVLPGWVSERRWHESGLRKVVAYLPFYCGLWAAWRGRRGGAGSESPRMPSGEVGPR